MHCNILSRMRGSGTNSRANWHISAKAHSLHGLCVHVGGCGVCVVLLVYDARPMGSAAWMLALRH